MTGQNSDARTILVRALADVLGESTASHLRGDSPLLSSAGAGVLTSADAMVLADAVEQQGIDAGLLCRLTDEDFVPTGSSLTVADLQSRIKARVREHLEPVGEEGA